MPSTISVFIIGVVHHDQQRPGVGLLKAELHGSSVKWKRPGRTIHWMLIGLFMPDGVHSFDALAPV